MAPADVIVVLAYGAAAADDFMASELFKNVPAVQAGRVFRLEQGPVAQAAAVLSPLNIDTVLPTIKEIAALAE